MRDPAFWWTEHSAAAAMLAPLGACYGAIAARNMARPGCKAPVPVICVGNFTLGGAGKTPTAIALARLLLASGHRPFFLSRGYGGRIAGPIQIDPPDPASKGWVASYPPPAAAGATACGTTPLLPLPACGERAGVRWRFHKLSIATQSLWRGPLARNLREECTNSDLSAQAARGAGDVGDEPLLLAQVAPTIVARHRPAGVKAATAGGADAIIMDDGLQNPSVAKDLAIAVVDGRRGIGNGRTFPAGPLRAPLEAQLDHADAVLVVGRAGRAAERAIEAAQRRAVPVFHGDLLPAPDAVAALAGKPVLAFAGIADPDKFFATLEAHGITVSIRKPFPDHHRYAADEMSALVDCARRNGLTPVTTEKDLARLSGDPAAADLIARSAVLPVTLRLRELPAVEAMLRDVIRGRRGTVAAA